VDSAEKRDTVGGFNNSVAGGCCSPLTGLFTGLMEVTVPPAQAASAALAVLPVSAPRQRARMAEMVNQEPAQAGEGREEVRQRTRLVTPWARWCSTDHRAAAAVAALTEAKADSAAAAAAGLLGSSFRASAFRPSWVMKSISGSEATAARAGPAARVALVASAVKAFYMEPDPDEEKYSLSVDMLAPEGYGEIIGGGQRIHDLDLLEKRIKEHDLPRSAFEWYLDLRRYGSVPHSGFGLGVERTVTYLCGLSHLRETIPFPRTINRLSP
jgi:hypothetical protein